MVGENVGARASENVASAVESASANVQTGIERGGNTATNVMNVAAKAVHNASAMALLGTVYHANMERGNAQILAAASDRRSAATEAQTAEMRRAQDHIVWSTATETAVRRLRDTLLPHQVQYPERTLWVVLCRPAGETGLPELDEFNGCLMRRTENNRQMCYESLSDALQAAGMASAQAGTAPWHTFYFYLHTTSVHHTPEAILHRSGQIIIPFEIGAAFNIIVDPRIKLEYLDTSFYRGAGDAMLAIEDNSAHKISGPSRAAWTPEAMRLKVAPEVIEEDRPWTLKEKVGYTAFGLAVFPVVAVAVIVDAYRGGPGELDRQRAEAAAVALASTTELRQRKTNELRARDFARELQAWRART